MAKSPTTGRGVAEVDFLVDENGAPVDVADGSTLRETDDVERTVGATGPTSWWRLGLIAVAVVALILLIMQAIGGGQPGTAVVPGTPVAAPDTTQSQ